MTKPPAPMFLEAKFDIDQISPNLAWHFLRSDGQADSRHGRDAGIIQFSVGETFYVSVKAGSTKPFESFRIIDCTLITKPLVYICGPEVDPVYAPPSPFVSDAEMGAVVDFPAAQFAPGDVKPVERYYLKALDWTGHLTVGQFKARWELSFVVTVEITRQDGSKQQRVFSFDPEGEVGSGVVPTMDEPRPAELNLTPEGETGSGAI